MFVHGGHSIQSLFGRTTLKKPFFAELLLQRRLTIRDYKCRTEDGIKLSVKDKNMLTSPGIYVRTYIGTRGGSLKRNYVFGKQ